MSSAPVRIREPYSKAEIGLIVTAVAALPLGAAVILRPRMGTPPRGGPL
jgi:hypothetical protein